MIGAFLLFLALLAPAADAGPEFLKELETSIVSCIGRKDTESPVFHGCIDWHSAAHGHWALFRIARALKQSSDAVWRAEESLSVEGLKEEEAALSRALEFENPYGRSWFLRLAIDFEKWAGAERVVDGKRLRPMADLLARSILRYEQRPVSPLLPEYQNASWAFYHLHRYYSFTGDEERLAVVNRIIAEDFVASREKADFGSDRNEFFSLYGNWVYLIAKSQLPETLAAFLSAHPVGKSLAPPRVTTSHSMGLVWSRAWALGALARKTTEANEKKRLAGAFEAHVRKGVANHELYKDDYGRYGHWVPQFAVYALTEALD